jgi:hypothetical protein
MNNQRKGNQMKDSTDRIEVQTWAIDRLVPYVRNPRKNDGAVDHMCRAATRDPACQNPGLLISVDIEVLIGEIHISPESDAWIEDVVKDVVAKYGLNKLVKRSKLYELT